MLLLLSVTEITSVGFAFFKTILSNFLALVNVNVSTALLPDLANTLFRNLKLVGGPAAAGCKVSTSIGSNELDTLKFTASNKLNSTPFPANTLLFASTTPAKVKSGFETAEAPVPVVVAGTSTSTVSSTVEGVAKFGLYP